MARGGKPLDVRQEAYRRADEYLARASVTKSAGPHPSRDELALSVFGPLIEALDDVLGTGDRVSLSGELVTKSARKGTLARALARNEKAARKLGESLRRFEESERQRQEAAGARQAEMAQKRAGQPGRPQFRELNDADLHRMRMVMAKVAEVDAEFAERMRQESEGA